MEISFPDFHTSLGPLLTLWCIPSYIQHCILLGSFLSQIIILLGSYPLLSWR